MENPYKSLQNMIITTNNHSFKNRIEPPVEQKKLEPEHPLVF
jgi:hypothetical protein